MPAPPREVPHAKLVEGVETIWQHTLTAEQRIVELLAANEALTQSVSQLAQRVEELQEANNLLTKRVTDLEGGWSSWQGHKEYWNDTLCWIWHVYSASIIRWSNRHGRSAPQGGSSPPEDTTQDSG